ncbi:MAG: PorV/PorQ family protein [Elusimicrobiota bacterium]
MLKKTIKIFLCLQVLTALAAVRLGAAAGKNSGEFLLIGVGARPAALGNSYTAVTGDVNSINWNPAGLTACLDSQVTFMHNQWLDDSRFEYLGLVNVDNQTNILGASISYLYVGNIKGRDEAGNQIDDFKAYDLAVNLSYATKLTNYLSLGGNLKIIRENIETVTAAGLAVDLGAIYDLSPSLTAGLVVQNLGPAMKYIEKKETLPLVAKIGFAYTLLDDALLLTLDANKIKDTEIFPTIGAEYRVKSLFSLRAGYNADPDSISGAGLTYGLGLNWKSYSFDYAFVPYGDLSFTNRFSITLKF